MLACECSLHQVLDHAIVFILASVVVSMQVDIFLQEGEHWLWKKVITNFIEANERACAGFLFTLLCKHEVRPLCFRLCDMFFSLFSQIPWRNWNIYDTLAFLNGESYCILSRAPSPCHAIVEAAGLLFTFVSSCLLNSHVKLRMCELYAQYSHWHNVSLVELLVTWLTLSVTAATTWDNELWNQLVFLCVRDRGVIVTCSDLQAIESLIHVPLYSPPLLCHHHLHCHWMCCQALHGFVLYTSGVLFIYVYGSTSCIMNLSHLASEIGCQHLQPQSSLWCCLLCCFCHLPIPSLISTITTWYKVLL